MSGQRIHLPFRRQPVFQLVPRREAALLGPKIRRLGDGRVPECGLIVRVTKPKSIMCSCHHRNHAAHLFVLLNSVAPVGICHLQNMFQEQALVRYEGKPLPRGPPHHERGFAAAKAYVLFRCWMGQGPAACADFMAIVWIRIRVDTEMLWHHGLPASCVHRQEPREMKNPIVRRRSSEILMVFGGDNAHQSRGSCNRGGQRCNGMLLYLMGGLLNDASRSRRRVFTQ